MRSNAKPGTRGAFAGALVGANRSPGISLRRFRRRRPDSGKVASSSALRTARETNAATQKG